MTKSKGNAGLADSLTEGLDDDVGQEPASPANHIMGSRSQTLQKLASGKLVNDRTEFVDPDRCKPWPYHNRDLDHLSRESCQDLIDSFLSAKRQRLPAIVRYLENDPDHDYEIIAGVRRWWTVRWLREHNHPEFDYLVTIQRLTDEEAFRVSDVENRARKDITDWERAQEYERALAQFYEGSQQEMAKHLNISKSWLTRLLNIARLPQSLVDGFADRHEISAHYARQIKPLSTDTAQLQRMEAEAEAIAEERAGGASIIGPAEVTKRLVSSATTQRAPKAAKSRAHEISTAQGDPVLSYTRAASGSLTVKIRKPDQVTKQQLIDAFEQAIDAVKKGSQ